AISGQCGNGGDIDNPAPAAAYHGHHERMRYIEKTIHRDIDHAVPLFCTHAGKNGIVMNTGVVYQYLDRLIFDERCEDILYGCFISDIKAQRFSTSACCADFIS